MKRRFNIFIIIAFAFFCFMPLTAFGTKAFYTYDAVGNMILRTGDDDNDGISNAEEISYGTDPQKEDTDADGIPDGWEVSNGLDPLSNDANSDPDYDGVFNYDEYIAGTNPTESVPTDLVLSYETITSGETNYYGATNSITAGPAYVVESGANVTFKAGNIIIMKPGFKANSGSDFHAVIE